MAAEKKKAPRVKVEVVTEETPEKTEDSEQTQNEKVEETSEATQKTSASQSPETKVAEKVDVKKEETETSDTKENEKETSPKSSPKRDKIPFWILFFAFLVGLSLGAGLVGGIFYYKTNVEEALSEVEPTNAPSSEIPEDEATTNSEKDKTEELDLSEYSISILNGSGIAGEAGKVENLLSTAGFTKTTAGNAKSYDYKATEVSLGEKVPDEVYDEIIDSLSVYEVEKSGPLESTNKYDVVITVGSTKK